MLEGDGVAEPDDMILEGMVVDIITDVKRLLSALVPITVDEIVVGWPEPPEDVDTCIEHVFAILLPTV